MTDSDPDTVRVVLRLRLLLSDPTRECVVAIGSTKPLGCWQEENAVTADFIGLSSWQLVTRLPKYQTTYWKWAVMDRNTREVKKWETRENRKLEIENTPLIASSKWDGEDKIIAIDPSISETLREKAAAALAEYIGSLQRGKNRNDREPSPHESHVDVGINTNTNAGDDIGDPELTDMGKAKYTSSGTYMPSGLPSKIPIKTSDPTCKGDAYLVNIHKSPDHLKLAYGKPRYMFKKKPIKILDDACKSESSLDTIDTVVNGLKSITKGNISRIPVKVKYNKCCNCKFNDIMFSLKASMKNLQEIEKKRLTNLSFSLQDQVSTVSDMSECLINFDNFKKSLDVETKASINKDVSNKSLEAAKNDLLADLEQSKLSLEVANKALKSLPYEEDFGPRDPPKTTCKELGVILPTKYGNVIAVKEEPPRVTGSWVGGLFKQMLSNLIVVLLAVAICKLCLQEFQCPTILQADCMFSIW